MHGCLWSILRFLVIYTITLISANFGHFFWPLNYNNKKKKRKKKCRAGREDMFVLVTFGAIARILRVGTILYNEYIFSEYLYLI